MTTVIIKKRRTLSLKRNIEPAKEEKPAKVEKPVVDSEAIEKAQQEIRRKKTSDCRKWMVATWPEVFDIHNPKPLAIGIMKEIQVAHHEAGGLEVLGFGCHVPLRRVLTKWVRHKLYHEAMTKDGAMRHNLKGEAVEPVSAKHANRAKQILESISKSQKKKG